jgi:MinD-like ATPase involved in chromosome partitioning or flagellar assembly
MGPQKMGLTLNDYLYGRSSIKVSEITRVLREDYEVNLLTDGFRKLMKAFRLDYLFIDTHHPILNEERLLSIIISDTLVLIRRPEQQDF